LPAPRPIPQSVLQVSDPFLRQRAIDIHRAASRLYDLIDRLRDWFQELRAERTANPTKAIQLRTANPATAIRLSWAIGDCVLALANFGVFRSADEAWKWFPETPSGELARKGFTKEEVDTIEAELKIKVLGRYKHDIPNWYDDDSYILTSIVKLSNLSSLQGRLEALWRAVELSPSLAADPPVIAERPLGDLLPPGIAAPSGPTEGDRPPDAAGSGGEPGERRVPELSADLLNETLKLLKRCGTQAKVVRYLWVRKADGMEALISLIAKDEFGISDARYENRKRSVRRQLERTRDNMERKGCPLRLIISANSVQLTAVAAVE
jgi:hypothetical protein